MATTQQMIDDATAAYHLLMTGEKVVKIQVNGRNVEYNQTSASDLIKYISDLKLLLNSESGNRRVMSARYRYNKAL